MNKKLEPVEIQATNWWLNRVKAAYECKTDAELARLLLTTKQAISMQRHGVSSMHIKTAVRAAELLGVNPLLSICDVMQQIAKTDKDHQFWDDVRQRAIHGPERCPLVTSPEPIAEGPEQEEGNR